MAILNIKIKGPCHTCQEKGSPGNYHDTIQLDHDEDGHPMLVIGEIGGKPARTIPNCHRLPFMNLIDENGVIWKPLETGWTPIAEPEDRATPA